MRVLRARGLIYPDLFYRELGENMSDEELRAMIEEFDKDGDGESKLSSCSFLHSIDKKKKKRMKNRSMVTSRNFLQARTKVLSNDM